MRPAICRVFADEISTKDADPDAINQQTDNFAAVLYCLGEFLRSVAVFIAAARGPRTVLKRTVVHAALVYVAARAHRHQQQQGEQHDAMSKHGNPGTANSPRLAPKPIISSRPARQFHRPCFRVDAGYVVAARGDTSASSLFGTRTSRPFLQLARAPTMPTGRPLVVRKQLLGSRHARYSSCPSTRIE
jgi:hypothetical protein